MKEWEDAYGNDVVLSPAFPCIINVLCHHCDKAVALVIIEEGGINLDAEAQAIISEKIENHEKHKKRKVN